MHSKAREAILLKKEVIHMSTHALPHVTRPNAGRLTVVPAVTHWLWLAGGLALGFSIPFLLADVLEPNRDCAYGLYAAAVVGYVGAWAAMTGQSVRRLVSRRLGLGRGARHRRRRDPHSDDLLRTEDSTPRPDGIELAAAIVWRGVVYGAADGLLLSVFPILVVFAAFAGTKLRERARGTVVVALIALAASLAMTAVYHAGYSDFRGEKLRQPVAGDVVWSAPTR